MKTESDDLLNREDATEQEMNSLELRMKDLYRQIHEDEPNLEGPYQEQDRLVGEGSIRLGTSVELR